MLYRFILLFLLSASNLTWSATEIAILDDENNRVNLAEKSSYIIDTSAQLSISSIASDNHLKHFKPIQREFVHFSDINGNVWLRSDIAIRTATSSPVILEVVSPRLQILDIYLPSINSTQPIIELGGKRPYSNRQIKTFNYVFSLPANSPPVFTLYLKLASNGPINAQVQLKTLSELSESANKELLFNGLLTGVLCLLLLMNVAFFFKSLQPMHLAYAGFLLTIAIVHLAINDQLSQFFPNTLGAQDHLYYSALLLSFSFTTLFSRLYTDSKKLTKKTDTLLILLSLLSALLAISFSLLPEQLQVISILIMPTLLMVLLLFYAIYAFIKSLPFSGFHLVARLVLFTGYAVWSLSMYGIIPSMAALKWGLITTVIFEALIYLISMITQNSPLQNNRDYEPNRTQTEVLDLLSDLSSRLRRQINIIGGGLAHLEQATQSSSARQLLSSSKTANSNIQGLIERIDYLNDLKDNQYTEQIDPIPLNQLIDNAYSNFQRLDQDNSLLDIPTEDTDHVEILRNGKLIQHLIEVLALEFKHFTDQTLTLTVRHLVINREGVTVLEINCYPLPNRIQDASSFDLGISYINYLVQHLKGDVKISDKTSQKRINIRIPVVSHLRQLNHQMEIQNTFDVILFGQEDDDLQKTLSLLQEHPSRIEHFDTLEALLDNLSSPEKREAGSIILVFDNGGHIPHITQQRILPLMRPEDQCLLISDNVKMSLDYAKRLGFDDILLCSELDSQFMRKFAHLTQKGSRLKGNFMSRINTLRKAT
ncbi:hypothetical protein OFY17_10500 [Marinomonas sp. C2222]|uniref:7TM diverse intracellular signaling n=1 Tax=Marinomonas sargassi TaxID=2984494 RepID=A0ABT2YU50_9GAMM|nr:7TM diverse intracellular signaling domain-containing protein [Marinomonas sargassi]MCV2403310.1 hypothetical protein [Marinomonas sargassi]